MNFKKWMASLAVLFLMGTTARAQDYKMGLGVRLSSRDAVVSNSVSFKYFLGPAWAAEGLLSFGDPLAIGLLLEKHKAFGPAGLKWFYGGGAYVGFGDFKNFGAQGVAGLDYKFSNIPLNLSFDWKPELNLIEHVSFEPAAVGISARFTF